jgi:cysteine desulfurase
MGASSTIYLDNSATTRVRHEVLAAMEPFQTDCWGNASSRHGVGRKSRQAIEHARKQVASLIGATAYEIFFTPCATYSNNVALLGRARYVEESGLGRHIITSSIEHSSALGPVKHLHSRGWDVTILNVDSQGFIDLDELLRAVRPETSIISIMWGNNEIGTLQPIEQIAAIASERGIFFHTDAVQVAGKLPIDVSNIAIDTLSLSGHKFHAPKGIGVLYIRNGVQVLPLMFGGGQESGLFPGTENVANIVGLGKAAELAAADLQSGDQRIRLTRIQELLIAKLSRYSNIRFTGAQDLTRRVPGHVSITVDGAIGEDICDDAFEQGICISSVSACSSKGGHPSPVLKASGLSEKQALGSVRISAGWFNTAAECELAADILSGIVAQHTQVTPSTAPQVVLPSAPRSVQVSPSTPLTVAMKPELHIVPNHIARRRIERARHSLRTGAL